MSRTKLFFVLLIALSFTQANAQYVQATKEKDFTQWLKDNVNKLPVGKEQVQEIIKQRESTNQPPNNN